MRRLLYGGVFCKSMQRVHNDWGRAGGALYFLLKWVPILVCYSLLYVSFYLSFLVFCAAPSGID